MWPSASFNSCSGASQVYPPQTLKCLSIVPQTRSLMNMQCSVETHTSFKRCPLRFSTTHQTELSSFFSRSHHTNSNLSQTTNTVYISYLFRLFLFLLSPSSSYLIMVRCRGLLHLITHTDTPQSVAILWTRDRPVAKTST
jgi:hypothetical protein